MKRWVLALVLALAVVSSAFATGRSRVVVRSRAVVVNRAAVVNVASCGHAAVAVNTVAVNHVVAVNAVRVRALLVEQPVAFFVGGYYTGSVESYSGRSEARVKSSEDKLDRVLEAVQGLNSKIDSIDARVRGLEAAKAKKGPGAFDPKE